MKKLVLPLVFFLSTLLYAELVVVIMDDASIVSSPPSVSSIGFDRGRYLNSSGGGDPLPLTWIKVTWHTQRTAEPLDLKCNGQVIATNVAPYRWEYYYDPLYGQSVRAYYRYYDAVAGTGTFTYEAEHAINTVSVTL